MNRLPRVLALRGEPGPSYKLVAEWPFAALREKGLCEVRYIGPSDPRLLATMCWCDFLFVVRGYTPSAALAVALAKHIGRFVVAYWDDNILEAPNAWYDQIEFRRCMVDILDAADMFAVANPRLGKILNLYSSGSRPTVTLKFPAVAFGEAPPALSPNAAAPIIGYAGGAYHKRKVEEIAVPALVQLKREGIQFRFQVFGPDIDVPSELDTVLEYHEPMGFEMWLKTRNTLEWTVALAPLPDSSFHNCKFQNKFLDYTALGAPGIYSNVPPYSDAIEHRRTGMLVENSPSAWANAIRELLADASLRERIVQESWQIVAQEHSMAAVTESYKAELRPAFEFRHPPTFGDKRALLDVTRWYAASIFRRVARLISAL